MVTPGLLPADEGSTVQVVLQGTDPASGRATLVRGLALVREVIETDEVLELEVDCATLLPREASLGEGGPYPGRPGRFVLLGCPRRREGSGLPAWRPVASTSPRVSPRP